MGVPENAEDDIIREYYAVQTSLLLSVRA